MQFTSFAFLLFATLTLLAYFLLPKRVQWVVLLASSLLFYAMSGVEYLFFILYTAAVTYLTSRALQSRADREDACVEANRDAWSKQERKAYRAEEKKKRFRVLLVGLLLGFGMLAVIKYTAFVLGNINGIVTAFGGKGMEIPSLLLPLGISFYTFQSMGYLIDVYRKTVRAEQNPAKLLLFVSFFPQLLQGPISRFGDLQKQLTAPHAFDGFAFRSGALRVTWGFFKKLIVADTAMMGIKTLIERTQAALPEVEIVLVATMLPNAETFKFWAGQYLFEDAYRRLLLPSHPELALVPMTSVHAALLEKKQYRDMTGNNVNHPNDFLARAYAHTILRVMTGKEL
jgi:D-alanyl-lipoteichoic acid acyltransferase DltB (MBOAT superfamily)